MPTVPQGAQQQPGLLEQQPSPANMLMAAADMHQQGRLIAPPDQQSSMPAGQKRPNLPAHGLKRKLKVVK